MCGDSTPAQSFCCTHTYLGSRRSTCVCYNNLCVQYVEHALSAVCNLAAGSQTVKQQIGDAGLVEPLLELLVASYDRSLSQLAALALRNLSRNPRCRQEILRLDGVTALLEFLSEGVDNLQYPLHCEVRCALYYSACRSQ